MPVRTIEQIQRQWSLYPIRGDGPAPFKPGFYAGLYQRLCLFREHGPAGKRTIRVFDHGRLNRRVFGPHFRGNDLIAARTAALTSPVKSRYIRKRCS